MFRAHLIRIYPTKEQEVQLLKTTGTVRYAYNWALTKWKSMYADVENGVSTEKPSAIALAKVWGKQRPDWARKVSFSAQQRAILDLGRAFSNFWKGTSDYPAFHKRGADKDSFYVPNQGYHIEQDTLNLPKIGRVRLAESLRYVGKIMSYTVSHYAGQWHVSVQVEVPDDPRPRCETPESVVGIDAGLKHIATASDGRVFDAPKKLSRLARRLKQAQRALSRKQHKSKNYTKQLLRKQKIQQKINNIRKDAIHKFTTTIAKNHGIVVVESLDIKGMMQQASKGLRRSLSVSMMAELIQQLEYKAQRVVKVDRYYPSTKTCSACGHVQDMPLDQRTFHCEECGYTQDRDLNAAYNLMKAGMVNPVAPVERNSDEAGRSHLAQI